MPGEDDLDFEQGTEPNGEQDQSLQEDQVADETLEGQVSGDGEGQDEDPDASGDAGQVDGGEPRRPNRAQSRIQALNESLRQERERGERLDREMRELRAEQQRRQQPQGESPEARAARRALMDPLEVMREDLRESEERTRQLLHQSALQQREATDKQTYDAVLRDNPNYRRFDAEVEKIRKEQADNGAFVPREVILDLVIGRAARAAAAKKAPKARQEGQRRIESQRTQPTRAQGDTSTARGRTDASLEKRLENIPL